MAQLVCCGDKVYTVGNHGGGGGVPKGMRMDMGQVIKWQATVYLCLSFLLSDEKSDM